MLKDTIEFIETGWSDKGKSHLVYWLKSIKNRYTWKPTEKQGEQKIQDKSALEVIKKEKGDNAK